MTLCGGLLFLLACGNTPKENPTTTNENAIESPLVGGDTDARLPTLSRANLERTKADLLADI